MCKKNRVKRASNLNTSIMVSDPLSLFIFCPPEASQTSLVFDIKFIVFHKPNLHLFYYAHYFNSLGVNGI